MSKVTLLMSNGAIQGQMGELRTILLRYYAIPPTLYWLECLPTSANYL